MRKLLCIVLTLLSVLCLCACVQTNKPGADSKKEISATIVDNEGNTVLKTVDELVEIAGNSAKFNKLYRGASIKFTGTVKKVETSMSYNGGGYYDIVFFEEGWVVYLPEDVYDNGKYADILAEINIGDKVTVRSDICYCNTTLKEIDIRGMASDNIGFDKESMEETVITIRRDLQN